MTTSFENELDSLIDDTFEKMWDDELENIDIDGLDANDLDNLVHTLVARRLVEQLRNSVRCSPGLLQCALRFLKDNDITSLPVPGSAHALLKEKLGGLPFEPRLTGIDL